MIIMSSAELRISVIIGLRRFSKGIVYKFILLEDPFVRKGICEGR